MAKAIRIEDIDQFLRDGGSIDDLCIEPEPSGFERNWSRVGIDPWCMDDEKKEV